MADASRVFGYADSDTISEHLALSLWDLLRPIYQNWKRPVLVITTLIAFRLAYALFAGPLLVKASQADEYMRKTREPLQISQSVHKTSATMKRRARCRETAVRQDPVGRLE